MLSVRRAASRTLSQRRTLATPAANLVHLVEVGPRDGLQNEKQSISVDTKVEMINRLGKAGMRTIEAGSFVSPKWVPQMAGTGDVVLKMDTIPNTRYQVLVPNARGLQIYSELLAKHDLGASPPATDVSLFAAATESFSRANTNTTIADSLAKARAVARDALDQGLRVRGYVSVVDTCPYEGKVDAKVVRDIARELLGMGCYEVSLGDTTGTGTPASIVRMLEEVMKDTPADRLAGHFHDTFGTAVANVYAALSLGLRTFDASVGGLGGCPYSPGATGNLATEDILYALKGTPQYRIAGDPDLDQIVEIGWWASRELGRESVSRAGRALMARKKRKESEEVKAKL